MYVTERLANWGANVSSDHSFAAREATKHAVLDVVGCMIAGAGDEGVAKLRNAVSDWGIFRTLIALAGMFMVAPGFESDLWALAFATPVLVQQIVTWRGEHTFKKAGTN